MPEECKENSELKMKYVQEELGEGRFKINIIYEDDEEKVEYPYDDQKTMSDLVKEGRIFTFQFIFTSFPNWFSHKLLNVGDVETDYPPILPPE